MTPITGHGPPEFMWHEPPRRWVVFAFAALGVLADATQLAELIPGI